MYDEFKDMKQVKIEINLFWFDSRKHKINILIKITLEDITN